MSTYVVHYVHPDEQQWNEFLERHLEWIQRLLEAGNIIASGPLPDASALSALIVMDARDTDHVDELLALDPFISEGLVTELTIERWEPLFGVLAEHGR